MANTIASVVGLAVVVLAMNADTPLGWVIGRIIGVFVPFIGAVLGYF
jgi:hypothetical protein